MMLVSSEGTEFEANCFSWRPEVEFLPAGLGVPEAQELRTVLTSRSSQSSPVSWVSSVGRVERSVMRREVLLKVILAFSL